MQSLFHKIESSLLSEDVSQYGTMLAEIMTENVYQSVGFDKYHWLTRARKRGKSETEPYTGKDIGMNHDRDNTSTIEIDKRWGRMFYLSTDLWYRSSVNEIKEEGVPFYTVGYFCINDSLKLFNATEPFAMAKTDGIFGGFTASDALTILVALINKWFNTPKEADPNNIYKVTNSIAKILRDDTPLDGIVYQSVKNHNRCWNIALKDDVKVDWMYSALRIPDAAGHYREKYIKSDVSYDLRRDETLDFIKTTSPEQYQRQIRSLFHHRFPG